MTVGEFAGVPLQDVADTWRTGAVFLARRPAVREAVVSLNGWTTSVVAGARAVVACGSSNASDHAGAFSDALLAANQGLDYMSAIGSTHSVIVDAAGDCIVWWPDSAGGAVIRASVVVTQGFDATATAVVTDPAGNVVSPPAPPAPMAQNAFRFMRMAKTSGDLFDAYRNLFLAFECLLDDIHPHQQGGEGQWFKAALAAADVLVPVARLAPPGEPDAIDWVYQNIYSDERSGLMHAKQRRGYLLPQDTASRANLRASLETLWRYVRDLVAAHLNVTSGSSHLSSYGWAMFADPVLRQLALFVSDDGTRLNADNIANSVLDEASTTVELQPTAPAADADDAMVRLISASCGAAELRGIDGIRRIGAKVPGPGLTVVAWSDLVGPLRLGDSVARFEVVHGMRSVSVNGAPTVFSS